MSGVRRVTHAEVVLGDNLHGEVVLLNLYVGMRPDSSHQRTLYLSAGVVGVVQDTELRVPALTVQVIGAVALLVEIGTPAHKFLYLCRSVAYDLLHGLTVGDIVAGYHCVLDMFLEVVNGKVGNRCHAALGKTCVGLIERSLANHAYLALMRTSNFKGITHTAIPEPIIRKSYLYTIGMFVITGAKVRNYS